VALHDPSPKPFGRAQKKPDHVVGLQSHLKQTAPAQGGEAGNGMPLGAKFIRLPSNLKVGPGESESQSIQTSGFPESPCGANATDKA
jgi:hypothetical protein